MAKLNKIENFEALAKENEENKETLKEQIERLKKQIQKNKEKIKASKALDYITNEKLGIFGVFHLFWFFFTGFLIGLMLSILSLT